MKKTILFLLLGVIVAFATTPTLVAPEGAAGIVLSPFVGTGFGASIYDNGVPMDGSTYVNIGSAQYDPGFGLDSRIADDFTLASDEYFGGVEFLGGEWNGSHTDWAGFDVEVFADDSGAPANPPGYPLHVVHVDWADITSSTTVVDNGDSWVDHIVVEGFGPIFLTAGDYWFSIWPYLAFPPQTAMMLAPNATGSEVYFSSGYFGYPDWVTGSTLGWDSRDIGFIMYGYPAVEEATWGEIKAAF
ncbi:hypothetical protein K8R78_02545 [bacterium]|nr:hypothetical protein [bacterium]